ncbi:hypothetical protein EUGRSUZ_C04143 [Eucalyptus grandis]|uniref:Uncharacterized protein n=2 Tax=Eucalyptus grandis TaxID=71139 RepID=A0ACC3LJR3_EUCGR|nr:hypothetical protein EUGRSUZ_C04143 [Eucalyptus grandis]
MTGRGCEVQKNSVKDTQVCLSNILSLTSDFRSNQRNNPRITKPRFKYVETPIKFLYTHVPFFFYVCKKALDSWKSAKMETRISSNQAVPKIPPTIRNQRPRKN